MEFLLRYFACTILRDTDLLLLTTLCLVFLIQAVFCHGSGGHDAPFIRPQNLQAEFSFHASENVF